MTTFIDLPPGTQFNRLTVIKRAKNSADGYVRWVCRCDCGTVVTVYSSNLRHGLSKSCGCYNREVLRNNVRRRGSK
jgi:hypothetical protein